MDHFPRSAFDDEIDALSQQIEDVESHRDSCKGEDRGDGSRPDHELAVEAYLDEMKRQLSFLADKKLAVSIASAVYTDSRENDENDSLDQPIVHDSAEHSSVMNEAPDTDEECIAGPSMTCPQRQDEKLEKLPQNKLQCCVCYDCYHPHQTHRLSCKHIYCRYCLKDLFLKAAKDQSLFPPRCCRQLIPLDAVQTAMSEAELAEFKRSEVEFSTIDRTYCSNRACGRFIPPCDIAVDRAQCSYCGSATCSACKNTFHTDDCVEDTALQATLALATSENWQRCFSCRAIVSLAVGCYHITCKCQAEFCYLCGLVWKTCECERWAEEDLLARAEEVVDRELEELLAAPVRRVRVERIRDELRQNHDCDHPGRFHRINGEGGRRFTCEICEGHHWDYILRCRRCHLYVCERCRRNRL
ncbi:hypothetical protein BO94DRAFT_586714 [Aspergillus sclerotioniger CBS 115572]|uniref:RBR-type E3 ubiquitin transferase n=1 Tax=Aspergillus sclerotioniger CBS 115572 TaxID=1450535 RepID=A0A317WAY2_9EURO|nr:hypothetical protein BO94DRAFT_586714 [Aspergillus sclerotioniger CBS 115572]PWY83654.1 hypothetical protein BO94DRAFT_586714 [Aspergillus sclerotioniger CBS 115572]